MVMLVELRKKELLGAGVGGEEVSAGSNGRVDEKKDSFLLTSDGYFDNRKLALLHTLSMAGCCRLPVQ